MHGGTRGLWIWTVGLIEVAIGSTTSLFGLTPVPFTAVTHVAQLAIAVEETGIPLKPLHGVGGLTGKFLIMGRIAAPPVLTVLRQWIACRNTKCEEFVTPNVTGEPGVVAHGGKLRSDTPSNALTHLGVFFEQPANMPLGTVISPTVPIAHNGTRVAVHAISGDGKTAKRVPVIAAVTAVGITLLPLWAGVVIICAHHRQVGLDDKRIGACRFIATCRATRSRLFSCIITCRRSCARHVFAGRGVPLRASTSTPGGDGFAGTGGHE